MDDDEYTVLDAIRDLTMTDRAFFSMVRFLDGGSRNHIVAAHLRNTSLAFTILRTLATQPTPVRESLVMNIPLNTLLDPSGNFMRNFLDPVAVVPTRTQIAAAVDTLVNVTDTNCAICQEAVESATRIRQCGHAFHAHCINEWFSMNTRCPVCRHDIRDLQPGASSSNNDRRVHTNEE